MFALSACCSLHFVDCTVDSAKCCRIHSSNSTNKHMHVSHSGGIK